MNGITLLKNKSIDSHNIKDILDVKNDEKADFQEFLSRLLSNLNTGDTTEPLEKKMEVTRDVKIDASKDNKKSTVPINSSKNIKDVLLSDLLKFVVYLKSNGHAANFPTDSKKLSNILNNMEAVKDFKNVKNLEDILKVAKKYDIKIEKFEIETLTKDNKEVLKSKVETVLKDFKDNRTKKIDAISAKILSKPKWSKPAEDTKKSDILSSLINKTREDKNIVKTGLHKKAVDENGAVFQKQNIKTDKDTIKEIQTKPQKSEGPKEVHVDKNTDKTNVNTLTTKNVKKLDINKDAKEKTGTIEIKKPSQKENKKESAKITQQTTIADDKILKRDRLPENELKISKKTEKKLNHKINDNKPTESETSSLKNIKNEKQPESQLHKHSFSNETTQVHSNKISPNNLGNTNRSLNSFAQDLRERIEQYKPPLMKIKMTLSPKDLGNVDVTILNRGNNLQVTISSNNNTMALFTQNQADFKNSLVNMGFTNLNMNFNSQSGGQKDGNRQQHKKSNEQTEEAAEQNTNEVSSIELTMPRYI